MQPERHLEVLRHEGDLIASLDPATLDHPVPTLPDWTVERVVRHLGKVHQWVAATLAAGPEPDGDTSAGLAGIPKGPDALPAYRQAVHDLLAEFGRHDLAAPAWSFVGPADVAWWARRQAQEISVHHIDIQDAIHAAGGAAPAHLAADVGADGIDEWARLFLATRFAQRHGELPADLVGRTVHIHGTDDPAPADGAEWLLSLGADGVGVEAVHAKGDVALRGPAGELLLVLWRRRPLDSLDVVGNRAVAQSLLDVARF